MKHAHRFALFHSSQNSLLANKNGLLIMRKAIRFSLRCHFACFPFTWSGHATSNRHVAVLGVATAPAALHGNRLPECGGVRLLCDWPETHVMCNSHVIRLSNIPGYTLVNTDVSVYYYPEVKDCYKKCFESCSFFLTTLCQLFALYSIKWELTVMFNTKKDCEVACAANFTVALIYGNFHGGPLL
jgi:hypothetical protein